MFSLMLLLQSMIYYYASYNWLLHLLFILIKWCLLLLWVWIRILSILIVTIIIIIPQILQLSIILFSPTHQWRCINPFLRLKHLIILLLLSNNWQQLCLMLIMWSTNIYITTLSIIYIYIYITTTNSRWCRCRCGFTLSGVFLLLLLLLVSLLL